MGRYDEAIADYDAALQIDPNKVASLYGRGMAKRRKGDYAGGNTDIAAAKAVKPNVVAEFARYGLLPPLTECRRRSLRSARRPGPQPPLPTDRNGTSPASPGLVLFGGGRSGVMDGRP